MARLMARSNRRVNHRGIFFHIAIFRSDTEYRHGVGMERAYPGRTQY